ncbi:MAG: OmpA family protein [Nannocystaceae bacterium]
MLVTLAMVIALADRPAAKAELDAEAEGSTRAAPARGKTAWIRRHAPTRMMGELGVFGGVMLPTPRLELFQPDSSLPDEGFRRLRAAVPELGARAGFYPLRFFGLELEGAVMPAKLRDIDARANLWAFRGHVVGQLGLWSVTPFLLLGTGAFGVASKRGALGNDVDIAIHFGGGIKIFATDSIMVRLDLRDTVSARRGVENGLGHSGELLLGLSWTPRGRRKPTPADGPRDRDGDGFLDDEDQCVETPGIAPDGCPRSDRDGDGFFDDQDKCVTEPGVAPDGCPRPDKDGDKIADDDDACPEVPENRNRYEDADGCPDEVPKDVAEFDGVFEGIEFDHDKDQIKASSKKTLARAVSVLTTHPELKVEIAGHTDSTGSRDYNLDLSRRRAAAVRQYLVEQGIAGERMTTRGYGPDEPIADNATAAGRQRNRRIEFHVHKD